MERRLRAVGLTRTSQSHEERAAIEGYCSRHGYELSRVVDDPGVATQLAQRTGRYRFDLVVATRWQHYGASLTEARMTIENIEQTGVRTQAVHEEIDTSTAVGRLSRATSLNHAHLSPSSDGFAQLAVKIGDVRDFHTELGWRTATVRGPLRVIGYVRVSTLREEQISPQIQEEHIKKYCADHGYVYLGCLPDLDLTGREFKKRVKIQKCIQMIADSEADVIVVWKWSRFGRNARQSDIHLGIVENDFGGRVECATEPVEAKTPIGRFQRGFYLDLAQFESDRIGEIWRDVHQLRLNAGLPHTGTDRLGYTKDANGRYHPVWGPRDATGTIIEAGLADHLKECYLRYIAGAGFRTLAIWLNSSGCRTTRGNAFSDGSLRASMDSGFAAGYLPKTQEDEEHSRGKRKRRPIWVKGAHDAIIDEQTWQAYLRERRRRHDDPVARRLAGNTTTTLSGLVKCPYCLSSMTAATTRSKGRAYRFFRCSRGQSGVPCPGMTAAAASLERYVKDWLMGMADDITRRGQAEIARQQALHTTAEDIASLDHQIDKINKAMVALTKAKIAEDVTPEDYALTRDSYDADRAELRRRKEEAEARASKLDVNDEAIVSLASSWDRLSASARNLILRKAISRIYVLRGPAGLAVGKDERVVIVAMWEEDPILKLWQAGTPPTTVRPAHVRRRAGESKMFILKMIAEAPRTVAELVESTHLSHTSVNKHLKQMTNDGLTEGNGLAHSRHRTYSATTTGRRKAGQAKAVLDVPTAPRSATTLALGLGTRQIDILRLLYVRSHTPQQISVAFDFTEINGRKHVQKLRALGLIEVVAKVTTGGHPASLYGLTDRGRDALTLVRR